MEVRLNDRGSSTTSLWPFNGPAPSATRLAIVAPPTAAAEARILQLSLRFISTLMGALQKYWPSLYCSRPSTCFSGKGIFWAHEKMLNEAGYVPSNSERYPLGGLVSAIENSFQATPEVICSKHDVKEIRLCFYKDFKPRNCLASKTSCPKYVSLPTYVALWRNETEMGIERISGDFEAL
ncbi:hypothetical protein E1A91_D11G161700v1 [Gossypium mustelinum]|uniref:Uncharacterized protein n=1 Tax=Gossypium mustelinum TaxID=34275 RepID=A0A5D2SS31_GOSMU|nr:hypothetical protein E1A91_D11G161700v1 [Gossypium mustelinum]